MKSTSLFDCPMHPEYPNSLVKLNSAHYDSGPIEGPLYPSQARAEVLGFKHMEKRWQLDQGMAAHLGVGADRIYKWITRKRMPAHELGRVWESLITDVDTWVKAGHAVEDVVSDTAPAGDKNNRYIH